MTWLRGGGDFYQFNFDTIIIRGDFWLEDMVWVLLHILHLHLFKISFCKANSITAL